jgi:carbon storage regulator CsrA
MPGLQLGRHVGESIDIGDGIRITIKAIRGHAKPLVTVEIDAPRELKVLRSELKSQPGVAK